jgi:hypothetical protein
VDEYLENFDKRMGKPMKLSEAGHTSNIDYWKAVAKRYQAQRDMAFKKSSSYKNAC